MSNLEFLTCATFSEATKYFTSDAQLAFRATHVNIRSIRKHWDEFMDVTSTFRSTFDVFVLTEINISADIFNQYAIPGYQAISCTRPVKKGGGVAVFVRDSWTITELNFGFQQAEVVALRMSTPALSLIVFALYRPPCFNGRLFLAELDTALSAHSHEDYICVIGDINIDTFRPSMALVADYLDLLSKWGLQPSIQKATLEEFLAGQLVVSCIDHINIRAPNFAIQSAIVEANYQTITLFVAR